MGIKDALKSLLPWQRKGYEVLDRYDTARADSADQKVLAQLVAHGANLSLERHVVHYLYFPDDQRRDEADRALREKQYQTRHGNDYKGTKSLIAERTGLVNESVMTSERELMESIAERASGEYDGWEAALD